MKITVVKPNAKAVTLCGHCGEFCYHKYDTIEIDLDKLLKQYRIMYDYIISPKPTFSEFIQSKLEV